MTVKHTDDIPSENVSAGSMTKKQVLIGPDEGKNFAMRRFTIQPGGGMPLHTNTVEHEQYVLRGQARIRIGDDEYEVSAGNVIFIPQNVQHSYSAFGEEPFEFICIIPNLPDTISLVE